jgi:hypothetical protein
LNAERELDVAQDVLELDLSPERPGLVEPVAELEQFFRLDANALQALAGKRRPATKLGWAVQWGTVRMLGTFLSEDPLDVPGAVLAFVAEQLGVDPVCAPEYLTRPKAAYEHAWEIRDLLELSEFSKREQEVRDYLAARVWSTIEGPRALFDRAVVHLLREGILLPAGITTLTRLISVNDNGAPAASANTLRDTFTTNLLRQGVDIVVVAELMGHARLDTTRRYTLPTHGDLEAAVAKLLTDQ